ncbi:MAG TPA: histidine kinase [Leifsonia sp.]|nr:histidine kinase [Leifsonia sp.]
MKRLAEFWSNAIDLLIDGALGPLWLTLRLTLYALGFVLVPVAGLGVLLLVVAGAVTRLVSTVERERAIALYDIEIPPPDRREVQQTGWRGLVGRARATVIDPLTWRLLLHHLVTTVIGLGLICLGGLVLLSTAFVVITVNVQLGVLAAAAGLLLLVAYVWLVGRLDRSVVSRLLSGSSRQVLLARVDSLADARRGAVDAASRERKRIERDLHDGIQPRLVSVAMTIDMARNKLPSDPIAAQSLLDQAHIDAKLSISELRDLARGIHPAILMDRGLDAALSAVAARCSVPTTVDVDLPDRLSPDVEAVVYFAVTEALTNVAKHSRALACTATVTRLGATVVATVTDNGVGGARAGEGLGRGGLSGMADRARSAGGRLGVESPRGGPTVITVEIPCAS